MYPAALQFAMGIMAIVFAVFGFLKGAIIQLGGLIGIILAFLLAPILGDLLAQLAFKITDWKPLAQPMAHTIFILLVGTGIYTWVKFIFASF